MDRDLHILLVEDDEFDVMMFEKTVKAVCPSASITHACDGAAALELIRAGALALPFAVVSDINMPRMGGHEFVRKLRQEDDVAETIVFMFSTSNSRRDIEEAYRAGVNGYIVKPDSRKGLAAAVRCIQDFWNVCELPITAA